MENTSNYFKQYSVKAILLVGLVLSTSSLFAQSITKSIRDFGAKGDGKTNDTEAFNKASEFFNKRNGNGILKIPKGIYIVGKQAYNPNSQPQRPFQGLPVLYFNNCKNMQVIGFKGSVIKYKDSLKFGAFNPNTLQKHDSKSNFIDLAYMADLSNCITVYNSSNVKISSIECNGNNKGLTLGGAWGDVGFQVAHYGLYIINSKNVTLDNIYMHHFGLDGMCVSNNGKEVDDIKISNSKFEYNSRQGFSWIGGNTVYVNNCSFNYTGKAAFGSSPGAGVDIEAENNQTCRNGFFKNCNFIDNSGLALGADSGPSEDMVFENCNFIGLSNHAVLVNKPNFRFNKCNFKGTVGWGYITKDTAKATKFYSCIFDNKDYQGKKPYGLYMVEIDGRQVMIFKDCIFNTWQNKVMWYGGVGVDANSKAIISNCTFNINSNNLPEGDFYAVVRCVNLKNNKFSYNFPKSKRYFLNDGGNIDLGGNTYLQNK
jgi:hypothetical protein